MPNMLYPLGKRGAIFRYFTILVTQSFTKTKCCFNRMRNMQMRRVSYQATHS